MYQKIFNIKLNNVQRLHLYFILKHTQIQLRKDTNITEKMKEEQIRDVEEIIQELLKGGD